MIAAAATGENGNDTNGMTISKEEEEEENEREKMISEVKVSYLA